MGNEKLYPKFKVGDEVVTDMSGKATKHIVMEITTLCTCETGISYKVKPRIPRSSGGWIDQNWFK